MSHFQERVVITFVDRNGVDMTLIAWGSGTTRQNAKRAAERVARRVVQEESRP